MQKTAIASFGWKYPGHFMKGAFGKYHPVKSTVNNISKSTGKNQGNAQHKSGGFFPLGDFHEVPSDGNDGNDSEKTQQHFAEIAAKLHPEGHTFIFSKMEDKPISPHGNFATGANDHTGFNPDF